MRCRGSFRLLSPLSSVGFSSGRRSARLAVCDGRRRDHGRILFDHITGEERSRPGSNSSSRTIPRERACRIAVLVGPCGCWRLLSISAGAGVDCKFNGRVQVSGRTSRRLVVRCRHGLCYSRAIKSRFERTLDLVSSPPGNSMPSACPGIPHCSLSPTLNPQSAASFEHRSYIYTCLHPHLHSHPHPHLQICVSNSRFPVYPRLSVLASMPSLSHLTYAAALHRRVASAPP